MIEKMKTVCIVATAENKDRMFGQLREMGVLHIKEKKHARPEISERFADLSRKILLLKEYPECSSSNPVLNEEDFDSLDKTVDVALEDIKKYSDAKTKASMLADQIRVWGDFDPSTVNELRQNGIELHFYKMGNKELSLLEKEKDINFIRLESVDKMVAVATVGKALEKTFPATEFSMPAKGLKELEDEIFAYETLIEHSETNLKEASKQLASYNAQLILAKNEVSYSEACETSVCESGLVWINGYIPAAEEKTFTEKAKENSWAFCIDDPADDDEFVPTKVKYTKLSGLMEPVFGILGTVPGYHEYDISFWFLMFFALFFAMIIGDAGYGIIFLGVAIGLNVKQKKLTNLNLLVYVVSITTIIWGAVTGTWFGLEGAMKVGLLRRLVIPPIANYPEYFGVTAAGQQNSMMQFCFIIGTVQLTLACIMNIVTKIKSKDLSLVADLGWLLSINALYYVVLLLVINVPTNITVCAVIIITGFVLVCLFGGMSPDKTFVEGLKSGLAGAFTNFLDTISAFGNIMSYIRLFAVGLASLAIAQSFNDMALGMTGFMKVFGIAIFVVGHALNLVMGLLSVIVHGIRLNLLEFSGQLGMEWSGTAYEPFKVLEK